MATLTSYLEESTGDTPVSLDQLVACKIKELSPTELESVIQTLETRLGERFQQAVEQSKNVIASMTNTVELMDIEPVEEQVKRAKIANGFHGRKWSELARFIPMRLTEDERRILAILDRTLKVSEYTDNVDLYISRGARQDTIKTELAKIKSVLSGQFVAMKMSKNTDVLTDDWFQSTFEIGRRYKAMNPDRMRETYVKLMYMLQDSRVHAEYAEWSQAPLKTVARELEALGVDRSDFLSDPLVDEVIHSSSKIALKQLVEKYGQEIELVLNSIKDYCLLIDSFLDPLNQLISSVTGFFDPKSDRQPDVDHKLSNLGIRSGENGSRLSHSHSRQFQYVFQSLRLWREVLMYFMPIWIKAEEDLLSNNYRLADTGQGLNRVQSAPNCSRFMHTILDKVQRDLDGSWIGSSVVHMGDHTVPNALMFLDKYCQIPRILGPVAHALRQLPKEYSNSPQVVREYIDSTFGSVELARRAICVDFFKHAFDGSGADNAYDAGSCIDGRLTSSWNWCSKIEKKAYFPLFLLTNFIGFDGQHGWS
jgi:hypothetical protein